MLDWMRSGAFLDAGLDLIDTSGGARPLGLPASREFHLLQGLLGYLPACSVIRQVPASSLSPRTPRVERDTV